jgi:hypothetical protein
VSSSSAFSLEFRGIIGYNGTFPMARARSNSSKNSSADLGCEAKLCSLATRPMHRIMTLPATFLGQRFRKSDDFIQRFNLETQT